jgi:hypothetical protein
MYTNLALMSDRTQCALIRKANRWTFYRDCTNLTEYINPLYGQMAELINVTIDGACNNHSALDDCLCRLFLFRVWKSFVSAQAIVLMFCRIPCQLARSLARLINFNYSHCYTFLPFSTPVFPTWSSFPLFLYSAVYCYSYKRRRMLVIMPCAGVAFRHFCKTKSNPWSPAWRHATADLPCCQTHNSNVLNPLKRNDL